MTLAVVSLTAVWVMLWGGASPANVVGGLAVSGLMVLVLPGLRRPARPGTVRPVPLLRLLGYVAKNVVHSNAVIVRDILSIRSHLHTGIVGVPLPECSEEVVTLITNLLALTPGTIPLEVTERPRAIFVHVLHREDDEHARRAVLHLIELCVRSFGSDADVRSLEALEVAAT
jgi:multicomponent Na+:H+ antiporter subunit E